MEISSRTIISWFFHLHGNVRAKASNISCASSVTFSPMLSVCVVIVKEREREREREVSVDTKRPARENGTSQKGWTFQMGKETTPSNNTFHSATVQDVHSSTIARGGTQKNARRRRSNETSKSKDERIAFVPATNCAAFTAVSNRLSCLPLSMTGKAARSSSSLRPFGGGETELSTFTSVLVASQLIICTW